ncbi:MAG: hypothetical protein MUP58_03625, partial [Candidatus Nanohaloarchaeota archaeon QJJ-9]|nr:hypothetical protein [Candidatus Nanohaloarchaeota archaeon QJJ-9]
EEGDIEDLERKKKSVEENLKKFKGGRKHHRIIEKAEKETERKSHRCSECGRNFYTKRGLKVHRKKMHEKKEKEKSGVLKKLKNIFNIR